MTDEQATYAINNQLQVCDTYPTASPTLPFKYTKNMLQSFCIKYLLTKCYVCFRLCWLVFQICELYITPQTVGAYRTVSVNCEWGTGYNRMVYGQTVWGMEYLDCSNQTLSRLDFKLTYAYCNVIHLHGMINTHIIVLRYII